MAVLVSDSFNRANSTTTLGTTDSANGGAAKTWVNYGPSGAIPTYGISTNRAYMVSNAGGFTTQSFTAVNAAVSDGKMTLTIAASATAVNLIFRASAYNNHIVLSTGSPLSLVTYINSTATTIATAPGIGSTNGDIFAVELNGSTINVYKNGTLVLTATSTFNQTATLFGFSGTSSSSNFVDDFKVEDFATGGTTQTGSSNLQGVSTITASATLIPVAITGSASLQGVATLSAAATVTNNSVTGAATVQGIGTLTATGSLIRSGGSTMQGVSTLSAFAAGLTVLAGASLTGVGWVMASGLNIKAVEVLRTVSLQGECINVLALQGEFIASVSLIGEMINKVALEGEI